LRLHFGDFTLDVDSRQLFRSGAEVHLQPKSFELLELFLRSPRKALSKRHIRACLWPDTIVGESSLTVCVAGLRAALGDDAKAPRYVRTVYGYGYAFEAESQVHAGTSTASESTKTSVAARVIWETRVTPLSDGENVLGRDAEATVRIDARGVSRRHACIHVRGERATLEDLGSKNGTYVGEGVTPIEEPTLLADGSTFRLGRVSLVFRNSPLVGSTVSEPAD
jgi:DNA-binding winged helix-turn-helix (wHTH) protein